MGFDDSVHWRIRRRDFLALSASLITAMSLGDTLGAGDSHAADTKFPEGRCGGKMEKKVLVTYASKYGSTGGVADAIGKELCSQGRDRRRGLDQECRKHRFISRSGHRQRDLYGQMDV